ncbi:distal tail protein Dit [Rossellomorea marisflavi]|uniref:distal tail protein Dit n=1 Tax=Rossellomorea marisflavi TaxID=189381 RepID=UPI003D2EACB8
MGKGMSFNGVRKNFVKLTDGREKSFYAPLNREVMKTKWGYRLKKTTTELLSISQPIEYVTWSDEDALLKKSELSSWLITKEPAPLQFDDEPGRIYWAVVEGENMEEKELEVIRSGVIHFLSFYTTGEKKELTLRPAFQDFTILGQEETVWKSKSTLTRSMSKYTLENGLGGIIELNYNFTQGDVIEVDYEKRRVTRNGQPFAVALSLSSKWFPLTPGTMPLKASDPTTVTYYERYH